MSWSKHTRESLEKAVRESFHWAEVCRKLGLKPASGNQSHIKNRVIKLGIDFSHFKGKTWNKGKTFDKKPLSYYTDNGNFINSSALLKRLIAEGIKKHKCERCGRKSLYGKPIPLELDHLNNNHFDNRLSNLKVLCPNCHSFRHKYEK